MPTVVIGLGSNLGDRHATLSRALDLLSGQKSISVGKVSHFREYPAAGGDTSQLPFLNAAALLHTHLPAVEVLRTLQETEERLGRKRAERWGPRTLDLDILLFDDLVQVTSDLTIPHPRLAGRIFALEPAVEIAPGQVHPVCGMTLAAILAHLRVAPPWIALAPAGFRATTAAFSVLENNALADDSEERFLRACEHATARLAADCVALLLARTREKTVSSGLPAAFDYRFAVGDARTSPNFDGRKENQVLMPGSASKSNDVPRHGSLSVPITASWEPVETALATASKAPAPPAEKRLPRVVIHGPTALQYLPQMSSAWQPARESQMLSDDGDCHSRPPRAMESERIVACVRREVESCRGKVPMVFVESQTPESVIVEVAGIVEGVLQSAIS